MQSKHIVFFICLFLVISCLVFADKVYLNNNDVLTGKVKSLVNGELTLETSFAGAIKIKAVEIKALSLENALPVKLTDNQVISGTIVIKENKMRLVDAGGTEKEITIADIKSIAEPPPPKPVVPLPAPAIKAKWSFAIEGGFKDYIGKDKTVTTSGKFNMLRQGELSRVYLGLLYNRAETNKKLSVSQRRANLKHEYNLQQRLYFYEEQSFESNRMINLDLKSQSSAGLGHHFVNTDRLKLSFDAGSSYTSEKYSNLEYRQRTIASRFTTLLWWRLGAAADFSNKFEYLPKAGNYKDYRTRMESAFRLNVTQQLYLSLSAINEYDNHPLVNVPQHSATYMFTVGLKF